MKTEVRFLLTFPLLFAILYGLNLVYIAITAPGGLYSPWLRDHLNYIEYWRTFNIRSTASILEAFGYTVKITSFTLWIPGRAGFKLVYSCLGYGIMSFLVSFVMTYPKPWRSKVLVLTPGLLLIQALNLTRFLLISLYGKKTSGDCWIDHHLGFNVFIYLVIITILYKWTNSNSGTCSVQA